MMRPNYIGLLKLYRDRVEDCNLTINILKQLMAAEEWKDFFNREMTGDEKNEWLDGTCTEKAIDRQLAEGILDDIESARKGILPNKDKVSLQELIDLL